MSLLKTNGIYCKQRDLKETGEMSYDELGNSTHIPYKKPTIWERAKYFMKYGYEMNMETLQTYILHIDAFEENTLWYSIFGGNAISLAKYFKKNPYHGEEIKFTYLEEDIFIFESEHQQFTVQISDDGNFLDVKSISKKHEITKSEIYIFIDWYKV